MEVRLINITPNIEEAIVEIARVSSSRKNKKESPEGLINYLIRNSHWSPFEHGFATFEVITSKAIGIQMIRHRSAYFQEFSQRYQDVNRITDGMFEPIEIRMQAEKNRQSSTYVFNPKVTDPNDGLEKQASDIINQHLDYVADLYTNLLEAGVAREVARMILPLCTKTKIYMTAPIRTWIHFLDLRDDEHAQKEIQVIAREMKAILKKELPIISKAKNW